MSDDYRVQVLILKEVLVTGVDDHASAGKPLSDASPISTGSPPSRCTSATTRPLRGSTTPLTAGPTLGLHSWESLPRSASATTGPRTLSDVRRRTCPELRARAKINVVLGWVLDPRTTTRACALEAAADLAEAAQDRLRQPDVLAIAPPYPIDPALVRLDWPEGGE